MISLHEAGERTGMSAEFWRAQVSKGHIPGAVRLGKGLKRQPIRVPWDEVERLIVPVTIPKE